MTLLYTGGMFLNDAVDQAFDRRYRPERPIVAGKISARTVWVLSWLWLSAGWLLCLWLGKWPAIFGSILVTAIVSYDVVHKRTVLAPLLMASCRFLVYVVAASAANEQVISRVITPAVALAVYIVGLSYLARGESSGTGSVRWTVVLVFAPALAAFARPDQFGVELWMVLAAQILWTAWCIWPGQAPRRQIMPRGVAGLLAGIVLVDMLAAAGHGYSAVFPGLFVLAILLQRLAPAT
jgi:4-hydroxybenzoate polyprenyltransferase